MTEKRPFNVTIVAKPKHSILYDLVKRFGSLDALAKELGISKGALSAWINLRTMPVLGKGRSPVPREKRDRIAMKLVELTHKPIEEIFPEYVREKLSEIPQEVIFRGEIDGRFLPSYEERMRLPSPEDAAIDNERRGIVSGALRGLSYRQQEVLKLRYGLGGYTEHTLKEVGHIFKLSAERIRAIEREALKRLTRQGKLKSLNPGTFMEHADS
ncbi:MAG: sigma-70 family RNA polymerase sigma factor [Planctomycetota bacterium]|jgi:RNA polymerase sigma factor (sigma-70 family)